MRIKTCLALYEFPAAAVTKDHTWGELQNLEFTLSWSWRPQV